MPIAIQASVSKTSPVRFDNKCSVAARAVGRPVEIQAYADRVVIRQDGAIVGEHRRRFGRGETSYDPWHYVPVLTRKPGALRNGAPFNNWPLPAGLERVRRKLKGSDDGDRQMVKVLSAVLSDGLVAVEAACTEALAGGVHSADVRALTNFDGLNGRISRLFFAYDAQEYGDDRGERVAFSGPVKSRLFRYI